MVARGTLDLQPEGITTLAGAGWEPVSRAGTHKGQLANISLNTPEKAKLGLRSRAFTRGGEGSSSPWPLTLMAPSEEG